MQWQIQKEGRQKKKKGSRLHRELAGFARDDDFIIATHYEIQVSALATSRQRLAVAGAEGGGFASATANHAACDCQSKVYFLGALNHRLGLPPRCSNARLVQADQAYRDLAHCTPYLYDRFGSSARALGYDVYLKTIGKADPMARYP
jgi:hypothetical protein